MANQLKVEEQQAILNLTRLGWGIRRIARELRLSRNTVRGYVRSLAAQTDPPLTTGSAEQPQQAEPPLTAGNLGGQSLCAVHTALVVAKLEKGFTAQRIYQDLQIEVSFAGSYESVKRFVRKLRKVDPELVLRIEVQPGEEVQVDFGQGPMVPAAGGGKRRSWIFRMVLSYSRKAYSEAVLRQNTETFLRCLENGFGHFGGVSSTINLDNLKAAVLKADWADPELNPKLIDFAQHCGTAILPCLPRTPEHKGKVENSIKYIKANALAGRQFGSLAQLNAHLAQWEKTVADLRIHGTTKRQVAELFALEKTALRPLPAMPFPCFVEGKRRVHLDGYVEVEKAYYDLPPEYLRREVWVRYDGREVRIFSQQRDGSLKQIQLHRRLEPGQFTKVRGIGGGQGSLQANLDYCLKQASSLGSSCARWAQGVVQNRGLEGMRSLMGLVRLTERHTFAAVNQACKRALAQSAWRVRDVQALLHTAPTQSQLTFEEHHPLIRNLRQYGLFIRTHTQNS